jgi:hypothetical protein
MFIPNFSLSLKDCLTKPEQLLGQPEIIILKVEIIFDKRSEQKPHFANLGQKLHPIASLEQEAHSAKQNAIPKITFKTKTWCMKICTTDNIL